MPDRTAGPGSRPPSAQGRHHHSRNANADLADYIRALGGELKVIADFGDSWRRVA
jgi:hypothetical protein